MICSVLTKKLYYCSVSYDTKNPYLRRQYARLYRLGIFPNYGKRPLYSETKERIKQLRKTEYQIDLIMKNDCTTVEDLEDAINESLDSIKNLKDQEKEHRTEVRSYQKEWSKYEKLEELEGAFLLFQEGNESFKKEALEYQKLKDVVKQFPHTKDELRKFLDHETAYEKNTGVLIADEFERLAVDYIATPAVLCKNHGPFTWGKDAKEAVHNAVVLEEVAKMAARCEQINPKVNPAPQELQDKHYYRKHGKNAYYGQSR